MNNTFFLHVNNHANRPPLKNRKETRKLPYSYTVAGVLEGTTFRIGVSICSPFDQFCKKVGRVRAEGRAKSNSGFLVKIPKDVLESNKLGKFFVETAKQLVP